MSSSDSDWSRFCGLNKKLRKKILLLHQTKSQVETLEGRLRELRQKQIDLEKELAPLLKTSKIRNPFQLDFTPIHRCPDEILFLIFEQYRSISEHDHLLRLLLVCKRWSRIAMDARLWTLIEVNDAELLDYKGEKARLPYISACLSRSRDLELDIVLHLYDCPDRERYIMESIKDSIRAVTDLSLQDIYERFDDHDWDIESPQWDAQIENAFDCILGDRRQHVKRWKSLHVQLPCEESLEMLIWDRLKGSFPSLISLQIDNVYPAWEAALLQQELGLFDLPKVKSLSVGDGGPVVTPSDFKLVVEQIERLEIVINPKLSTIADVSKFINLRSLKLISSWSKEEVSAGVGHRSYNLFLPHLITLCLHGCHFLFGDLKFDFPYLQTLKLEGRWRWSALPRMSPRHILWEDGSYSAESVRDILLLSSCLESITVMKWGENLVLRVVAKEKEEGRLESLVKVIVVELTRHHRSEEVIDVTRDSDDDSDEDETSGDEETAEDVDMGSQEENNLEEEDDKEEDSGEDISSDEEVGSDDEEN